MKSGSRKYVMIFAVIMALIVTSGFGAEDPRVTELSARAQEMYDQKKIREAINLWLQALAVDPNNDQVQQKIEMVYETKHRRDISLQRAKMYLRIARNRLEAKEYDEIKRYSDSAIENFVAAYRIDPEDPEIFTLRDQMRRLQNLVDVELEKQRVARELREKYERYFVLAKKAMSDADYDLALDYWDEMLNIFENDPVASAGKRRAELAINNRKVFEKVRQLFDSAAALYEQKKYSEALSEFRQILDLDAENEEAQDYIAKINDELEEQQNFEQRKQQAEQFYIAGLEALNINDFERAKENFENSLGMIRDYKDVRQRLAKLADLEKEYQERLRRQRLDEIDKEFQSGLVYLSERKYREALAAFERTVRMDPQNEMVRKYIVTVKEALQQEQEEVIDRNSPYYDIVQALILSGKQLYNEGNYRESRLRWERILRLFPKNRVATEYLLRCQMQLDPESFKKFAATVIEQGIRSREDGRFDLAFEKFNLVKSISASYEGIDDLIASVKGRDNVLNIQGDNQNKKPVDPAEIQRLYDAGMTLYSRGGADDLRQSLAVFQQILAVDPGNLKVAVAVNKIGAQLRIGQGGVDQPRTGLTPQQEQLVRELYFRGISYYSANKFDLAIAEWQKVLAIDPNNVKARNNIQQCLLLMRR